MESSKDNVTVQGIGLTPVPAALESEQAGSQPSRSYDRIVPAVGNLAAGTKIATSPFSLTKQGAFTPWVSSESMSPRSADPFKRSARLPRSPTGVQISEAVSLPNLNAEQVEGTKVEFERANVSKVEAVKKQINNLFEYVKDRHNVHGEIKRMIRLLKVSYNEVEKEFEELSTKLTKSEVNMKEKGDRVGRQPETNLLDFAGVVDTGISGPLVKEVQNTLTQQAGTSKALDTTNPEAGKRRRESPLQTGPQLGKKKRTTLNARTLRNPEPAIVPDNKNKEEMAGDESEWQKVPRRRKRNRRRPPRPDALLIKKKGDVSYADLLRKMKLDPELTDLGEKVTHIRQTTKGDLLLELECTGNQPQIAVFQSQLVKSIGEKADVKALTQETLVEIRDIDEVTTHDDVLKALEALVEDTKGASSIKTLKASYRGTQMAVANHR